MDNLGFFVYFKVLGSLFLLLGALVLLLYGIKRYLPPGNRILKNDNIKVLGQINIGPKKSLVVVQFLNSILLIGVTESNICLIKELETDHDQNFESLIKEKVSDSNPQS